MAEQDERERLDLKGLRFGDVVENGWASEGNPTRTGYFVREGRRTGRMNPGRYLVVTDGAGKYWELPVDKDHKITVRPGLQCDADHLKAVEGENERQFQQIGKYAAALNAAEADLVEAKEYGEVLTRKFRRLVHETGPAIIARAEAAEASRSTSEGKMERVVGALGKLFSAEREAFAEHRRMGGLADSIDNAGKPYQSQFLANTLLELRQALSSITGPGRGGE